MNSWMHRPLKNFIAGAAGVIAVIIADSASAEVIYLKSGGSIRGIVTGTEGGMVTIDVGFGETSLDTADIDSIARSGGEELLPVRRSGAVDGGRPLPPPLKSCFESMRRLRTMRFRAVNRQAELDRLDGEIDSLEHVLGAGAEEYESLNKELGAGAQKSLEEEIHFIGKAHRFNASIVSCQRSIAEKKANQQQGNPLLLEYIDSLDRFDERFKEYKKTCDDSLAREHLPVVSGIENDVRECKAEFRTARADVTFIRGNHIVVPVVVNKRGTVLLLLDTGASTVTLSRAAAAKLGIDCDAGNKVLVSLANGTIDTGYSVLLRSVAVGDFRADNVRAIVHDKAPGSGIEGLLGMSYLRRFALHIDPVNKKLVLRKIDTR